MTLLAPFLATVGLSCVAALLLPRYGWRQLNGFTNRLWSFGLIVSLLLLWEPKGRWIGLGALVGLVVAYIALNRPKRMSHLPRRGS